MARRNALIAALLVAVLAVHGLALQWLAWQALEQSELRLMTTPMFTRLLQPQAPPPPPAPAAKPARAKAARAPEVIQSVAPSTPQEITTTAPAPEVVAETAPTGSTDTAALTPAPAEEVAASAAAAAASAAVSPSAEAAATPTASETSTATATATVSASGPASQATLDSWPADTRLNYRVGGYYRGELHGTARVQWQRQGERYQTRVDIDMGVVSLVMTSQGEVTEQGLSPKAYEELRASKRRSVVLQDARIVLSDGRQVPRPEGVQDTASQFVELSHRFASGQLTLEVGRSVSFFMARPGGVDLWTYDIAAKEVLKTPQLGEVEAFHLKPRPLANPRGNITAEMWFAPSLQYLPVRIRVTAGDAHVDLFVEKIEQR